MSHFKAFAALLAFVACFAAASDATAGFIWKMDDNAGNTVTLFDGDADGVITFAGSVGSFTVSGTALSKPNVGGPGLGQMGFEPLRVTTTDAVAAPLTIQLTDTDFPDTSAGRDRVFMFGQISNGSVTGSGYFDPANLEFGTGGLYIPMGTFTAPPNPTLIDFNSGWIPFDYGPVPYSITLQLQVEATGALDLNFRSIFAQQVPEPSTVLLALIGVVVLGGGRIAKSYRKDRQRYSDGVTES